MNVTKTTSQLIKENNVNEIFRIIREEKAISRVEIAQKMQLSQTSVGRSVAEMVNAGYVVEGENVGNSVGRQRRLLHIAARRALAIGVYLKKGWIHAGLVDVNGTVLAEKSCAFTSADQTDVMAHVNSAIDALLHEMTDRDLTNLVGIGVTVVGASVNYKEGIILHAEALGWHSFNLGSRLKAVYPYTIIVDTDVNSEAKAQKFLNTVADPDEFLVVHLGTGISLSQMINGNFARGYRNCAGEMGHVIVDPNGAPCECGRRGCLNTVIGRNGIEKQLGMPFSEAIKKYHENDRACSDILNRSVNRISIWLANLIHLYDPREVVLTGSMIDEWDEMFDMVVSSCRRYMGSYFAYDSGIKRPKLRGTENSIVVAASNIFYKFTIKDNENYYDYSR